MSICPACDLAIHPIVYPHHLWTVHKDFAAASGLPNPFEKHKLYTACPLCFRDLWNLSFRKHLKSLHQIDIPKEVQIVPTMVKERREDSINYLKKFFPDLKGGAKISVICPDCGETTSAKRFNRHYTFKHGEYHPCSLCDKVFKSESIKQTHVVNDHKIVKYRKDKSCPHCDKLFASEKLLKDHISVEHENVRAFLCDHCGKSFKRPDHLHKHRTRIHLKLRQYQCKMCEKRFASSGDCRKHLKNVHKIKLEGRLNNPFTSSQLPIVKLSLKEFENRETEMSVEDENFVYDNQV